jgi:hypothetical protein
MQTRAERARDKSRERRNERDWRRQTDDGEPMDVKVDPFNDHYRTFSGLYEVCQAILKLFNISYLNISINNALTVKHLDSSLGFSMPVVSIRLGTVLSIQEVQALRRIGSGVAMCILMYYCKYRGE